MWKVKAEQTHSYTQHLSHYETFGILFQELAWVISVSKPTINFNESIFLFLDQLQRGKEEEFLSTSMHLGRTSHRIPEETHHGEIEETQVSAPWHAYVGYKLKCSI